MKNPPRDVNVRLYLLCGVYLVRLMKEGKSVMHTHWESTGRGFIRRLKPQESENERCFFAIWSIQRTAEKTKTD